MTTFMAGPKAVQIRYRNYRGEDKIHTGDWTTIRSKGAHVSLRLEPTGRRVTFALARIVNRGDIDAAVAKAPKLTNVERQILGYYQKRGGTSAKYEALKQKYPQLS